MTTEWIVIDFRFSVKCKQMEDFENRQIEIDIDKNPESLEEAALIIAELKTRLAETIRKLEEATKDPLTGLDGENMFNEKSEQAIAMQLRDNPDGPISFLMIDVDGLKKVNDSIGHQAGDDLLKMAAQSLRMSAARLTDVLGTTHTTFGFKEELSNPKPKEDKDLVGRRSTGADEFKILLPNTPETGAIHVSNIIHENFYKLIHEHPDLKNSPVSLSIGIVCETPRSSSLGDLEHKADQAMYRAKMAHYNEKHHAPNIKRAGKTAVFKTPEEFQLALS